MAKTLPSEDDADAWKHTLAKPERPKKLELDSAHECPMCLGKGFVYIVDEKTPPKRKRIAADGAIVLDD